VKPMSGNLAELIVKAVKTSISPAEAHNVAIVIPWLSELLGRTGSDFVTANLSGLTAFCQEREKTRNERSMDRLIGNLRVIFQMLVNEGLRTDNPACLLPSPVSAIIEDGLGWALAIGAGGRKSVPHGVRPATSIEQLALMVERFHPLGSLTSRISNSQSEE
jgi:hypothetical protein